MDVGIELMETANELGMSDNIDFRFIDTTYALYGIEWGLYALCAWMAEQKNMGILGVTKSPAMSAFHS